MNATDLATSALVAQWIEACASAVAVVVAVLFGILTLVNTRRSRDNQERATLTAASDPATATLMAAVEEMARVRWSIQNAGGERWLLTNNGSETAHQVSVAGLTELDRRRLTVEDSTPRDIEPAQGVEFVLVSRLTLSGPANLVLTYVLDEGGPMLRKVLRVPAP